VCLGDFVAIMSTRVVFVAGGLAVAFCAALVAWPAPVRSGEMLRTTSGQPDLQGVWQTLNTAAWNIQDHSEERYPGLPARFSVPAGQGVVEGNELPYRSWAAAKEEENYRIRLTLDAEPEKRRDEGVDAHSVGHAGKRPGQGQSRDPRAIAACPSEPSGVPRSLYVPTQIEFLQTNRYVLILFERARTYRVIPTTGILHLGVNVRLWMGDSRGHWEGKTLVVDVTNHNAKVWFDQAANFYTDAVHRRAVHPDGSEHDPLSGHDRRSKRVHPPMDDGVPASPEQRTRIPAAGRGMP
jgi:hypothetical protein